MKDGVMADFKVTTELSAHEKGGTIPALLWSTSRRLEPTKRSGYSSDEEAGRGEGAGLGTIRHLRVCVFTQVFAPIVLGLRIGTNQSGFLGGFLKLSDAESGKFHFVPNQGVRR